MINILWDQKFEVGHERIDAEHRIFLNLIRALSLADEDDSNKARILRLLLEVEKYAEFHFISEENIMIDVGYPDYAAHRHEHLLLLSRLEEEFHAYNNDDISLEHVVDFLFEWFALHTTQRDIDIARHIAHHASHG